MSGLLAGFDKHRLAGLQDGVYSIAMTLLVLELKLPPLEGSFTDAQLWANLAALWPKVVTWMLSFWVLTVFWTGDARNLQATVALDRTSLRLALWKLALVSLLPFSTALMGEHGDRVPACVVYSAHFVVLAVLQVARIGYLRRHADLAAWSAPEARQGSDKAWSVLICALGALALAFVAPRYNMLAMVFMPVVDRLLRARPGGASASVG